jgi:hypothetical protein
VATSSPTAISTTLTDVTSGGLARQFPHVWRQGNACGLEDAADHAFDVGAGDDALAVFLDDGLLQPIMRPVRGRACGLWFSPFLVALGVGIGRASESACVDRKSRAVAVFGSLQRPALRDP